MCIYVYTAIYIYKIYIIQNYLHYKLSANYSKNVAFINVFLTWRKIYIQPNSKKNLILGKLILSENSSEFFSYFKKIDLVWKS